MCPEPSLMKNLRNGFCFIAVHRCDLEKLLPNLWREAFAGSRARRF